MNEDRIIQSLTQYQGTQESLDETVAVLSEELGPNWTEDVFEKLGDLSVDLKEKLNHVFNYYAALMAWQETQAYLEQSDPLNDSLNERLPVLKHWLEFFGDQGLDLYHQLEQKISSSSPDLEEKEVPPQEKEEQPQNQPQEQPKEQSVSEEVSEKEEHLEEEKDSEKEESVDLNSDEAFKVKKAQKEIELLDALQAWLSARCLQLNNMEVFAYPYYGLVVDLMRQTVKEIQSVLDITDKSFVNELYEGGEEALTRKKQAIEADIETAVQNCESATTALIDKDMDMDQVRKTLGNLDENTEPEYLGPAPDGFELIQDSDAPLDENAVKEQYQRLEKEVMAENKMDSSEKKTSQTSQNSVQRKLSFSLKPKK